MNTDIMENYRSLLATVQFFSQAHAGVDLTILTDAELQELETPIYVLQEKIHEERRRRDEEHQIEQERLKARYGYRYPKKAELTITDIRVVQMEERAMVRGAYKYDKTRARDVILSFIPTITDEEIEGYLSSSPIPSATSS